MPRVTRIFLSSPSKGRRWSVALPLLLLVSLACCSQSPARTQLLSNRQFEQLVLDLSEAPGYFDTDNLISNETSFQHVIPALVELTEAGGAYLGVGPDQNYTYIAQTLPRIAFIIDIRRENLLQHLFFKEIFHLSKDRWEFLSVLFGKPLAPETELADAADALQLVRSFRRLDPDPRFFEANFELIWGNLLERHPRLVLNEDRAVVLRMYESFYQLNLDLRFRSHGRAPRLHYPTLGELLTETDLTGRQRHYLSAEEYYRFVWAMHVENRIIPVVGDLAGTKTLRGIGRYLQERGYIVSAFYTSNVEFYLFQNGSYLRFVENLEALPVNGRSLFIRSHFGHWRRSHPEAVPGYFVTSLLQRIPNFLAIEASNPYRSYSDVLLRDYLPVKNGVELVPNR